MTSESRNGEYTRYQCTIQRGDGIDQRGDITVEVVRERDRAHEPGANMAEVTLPNGETMRYESQDAAFGEFYAELTRATGVMLDVLGMDDGR